MLRPLRSSLAFPCIVLSLVACGGNEATDSPPPASTAAGGASAAGAAGAAGAVAGKAGQGGSSGQAGKSGGGGAAGGGAGGAGGAVAGSAGKGGGGQGGASAGQGGTSTAGGGQAGGGKAGAAGTAGAAGACASDNDCKAKLPSTTPAGCGEATCEQGACHFRSHDADGDGHRAAKCLSNDPSTPIQVGNDCDDANASVSPDGWDGPNGDGKPDHCDGIDQDCSGTADDQKLADGATCVCAPGDVTSCSELPNGQPVAFPTGKPVGACKLGSKTCAADGKWGPCGGTVGALPESCNSQDDNCNGLVDDGPPPDAPYWSYDADDDLFAAKGFKKVQSCQKPTAPPEECPTCDPSKWKAGNLPATDCDDTVLEVNPGATEQCNGIDDDCDGKIDDADTNVAGQIFRYYDGDGDNHGDKTIAGIKSCVAPVNPASCPTCDPTKWKDGIPADDCDDKVAEIFPGRTEICDGYDNNCDGNIDETGASNVATWWLDVDGDNHAPVGAQSKTQCTNPGNTVANCPTAAPCPTFWKQNLIADDCDDSDAERYPGKAEVCDGKDNDCNGTVDDNAAGVPQWSYDGDGDGFSPQGASAKTQCTNPGEVAANCVGQPAPCTDKWVVGVLPATDCNDLDSATNPAAWDGPASAPRSYGFAKPGLTAYFFNGQTSAIPASNAAATQTVSGVNVIDANLGTGAYSAGVGRDNWSVRYEGLLTAPTAGAYTFHVTVSDGAFRLKVGGTTIVDKWLNGAAAWQTTGTFDSAAIALAQGDTALIVEAYDTSASFSLKLEWEGPGVSRQVTSMVFAPGIGVQPERCGGDNNCNGTLDDSLVVDGSLTLSCSSECAPGSARPCGNGVGECKEGVQVCDAAGKWPAACSGDVQPTTEVCDNKDNDCNGSIDNGLTCACTNGAVQVCGVCQDGQQTCANGAWGACTAPDSRVDFCPDIDKDGYCWFGNAYSPFSYSTCGKYCANVGAPSNVKVPAGENWLLKTACPAQGDCLDTALKGSQAHPGGAAENTSMATAGYCDNLDNDCNGLVDDGTACSDQACPVQGSSLKVPVWPLVKFGGDNEFSVNGPHTYLEASYSRDLVFSTNSLQLERSYAFMRETTPDWTEGRMTNTSDTVTFRTGSLHPISSIAWGGTCSVTSSNGNSVSYVCTADYNDTSTAQRFDTLGGVTARCTGQTPGDDLCSGDPDLNECAGCWYVPFCISVKVKPQ